MQAVIHPVTDGIDVESATQEITNVHLRLITFALSAAPNKCICDTSVRCEASEILTKFWAIRQPESAMNENRGFKCVSSLEMALSVNKVISN
jgi:hypothetical protein